MACPAKDEMYNPESVKPSMIILLPDDATHIVCAKAKRASLLSLKDALLEYPDSECLKRFYLSIPEAARQYP